MTKHDDLELTYAGCLPQTDPLGRGAEKRAELRSDYSRFKVCSSRGMDSGNSLDWPTNGFSTVICLDELDSLYQFHTNMYYQKRGPRSGFFTGGKEDLKTVRLWRNWLGSEEEEDVEQSPREKDQIIWTGCAPDAIGFTVSVQRHTPSGEDEDALQLSSVGGSREACEFYKVRIGEVLVRNSYLLALRENLVN
ncbi:hypothetical protein P168DRAFT_292081 [Aspergillus campestris IBT 28561]|uniref:Uncharacterized protein n=1 Tax=Aspergillus campestris (strain IBT 28561) TaxID=1392248 RepID=A0A2I1CWE3_ASPC2|nr:uncharacterized protein P168DRAFT_292081 [Aspergillus campestris IBT 28561]PKY01938.1 hypothetical protein P168DRAFT_292081 [Aspergillus campestris IBT 28561]